MGIGVGCIAGLGRIIEEIAAFFHCDVERIGGFFFAGARPSGNSAQKDDGCDQCTKVGSRTAHFFFSSYGAPVPDEPRNSFLPSGRVMSRPLARMDPSFDW